MRFFIVTVIALDVSFGQSHVPDTTVASEWEVEELLENITTESDESQEADLLEELGEEARDVNRISEAELEAIPGISPLLARKIVARRAKEEFTSLGELLDLAGRNPEVSDILRRYLTVRKAVGVPGFIGPNVRVRSRVQRDNPASGTDSRYLGSLSKVYNRVLIDIREADEKGLRFEGGVVSEKDAGERYADSFTAGYLFVNIPRLDASILLGDFVIESAKGLMFWRSSGIVKGGDIVGVGKPKEMSFKAYRSTDENHFFRGVALRKDIGPVELAGFFSSKRLNGSTNEAGVMTSLDSDGLFRTESELRTLRTVREIMVGGIVAVRPFDGFVASVKGAKVSFDHLVQLSSREAFSGREADILAADFILKSGTMAISGEMARDKNGSVAASLGLYSEPTPMLSTVLAARIYPPSFNSLHGFALSEGGGVEGEEGLYFGAAIRPSSWISGSFLYDVYTLSNRFPFRSDGNDFLAKAKIRLSRRWEMSVQYRRQNKPGMFHSDEHGLEYVRSGRTVQERYRWSLLFAASDALHWQSRIEATVRMSDSHAGENGYLVFQEMRWQVWPLFRLTARLAVFETDGYDARLYTYEQDVPGGFSNIPLWDSGFRTYILLEYALTQGIRISGKYSRLFREPSLPGSNIGLVKERFTVQCDVSY